MGQVIAFPRTVRREQPPGGVEALIELARLRAEWNRLNPGASEEQRDAAHAAIAERLGL